MKALTKRSAAIAGMCALALSGALLAGCSSSNSDQEILDKLNQMETEIAELKGAQAADGGQAAAGAAAEGQNAPASATDDTAAATGDDFEAMLADLETRAAAAVETAGAVAVPQDPATRPQAYFDAKAPLESLEHEADQLEDRLEAQYRQGALERDAFWSYDQRVSAVEDSLDRAADDLELRMGVDD